MLWVLFFLGLSIIYRFPPFDLLTQIPFYLYVPHHNSFSIGLLAGRAINTWIYLMLLLSVAFALGVNYFRGKSEKTSTIISFVLGIYFFHWVLFQTIGQFSFFTKESNAVSLQEINPIQKQISQFAQFCQQLIPGEHRARLITGLDLSKDPGMIMRNALAYYLYPIDIRKIRKKDPVDYLIIFAKKDARKNVPENYIILGEYDSSNILAVKRNVTK